MAIVFNRDASVNDGLSINGVIRGCRIITARGPYPLVKLELEAFEGRLRNRFQTFVWHPANGWLEVLSLDEADFPFTVTDTSLEECFQYMEETIKKIFAGGQAGGAPQGRGL